MQTPQEQTKLCIWCGADVLPSRWILGYHTCLVCGEAEAIRDRSHWCIAPMHKSNYMLITNLDDLKGLNNKGGLVK